MEATRGQTTGPGRNDDPKEVHTWARQQEDTKPKHTEPKDTEPIRTRSPRTRSLRSRSLYKDMEPKDTEPKDTERRRPDHAASEYQAVLSVASSHATAMLPNLDQLTTLGPSTGPLPLFFK
jgi:hypothetical protein